MNIVRKLWGCGPFCRGTVVGLVAAPVVAAGALFAPALLLLGLISPGMYKQLGQSFVYAALAFLVFASFCFASALQRGELHNFRR